MNFEPFTDEKFPSGDQRALAELKASPEDLSRRLGVTFHAGSNDLAPFVNTGLKLPSGRLVVLLRYEDGTAQETTVFVDREDDHAEALQELCSALELDDTTDFSWVEDGWPPKEAQT